MRLLIDAHVSPAVGRSLRQAGVDALALQDWQGGWHRDASHEGILESAMADGRVLVTYDCRTIPVLLKTMVEDGREHGGVLLVDERTIRSSDIGRLVRALRALVDERGNDAWLDQVVFLRAR